MSDAPPPRADRNLAIDAVKGVGILQVVLFHSLGQGARNFATKGDRHWVAMRALAWATNFAIPPVPPHLGDAPRRELREVT